MYRQTVARAVRPAFRPNQSSVSRVAVAQISTTSKAMAGGDTGAPRSSGIQHGDAFTKREKANEDYAIRLREKEKLAELRKKLQESRDHLQKLEDHIDEMSKDHEGGGTGAGSTSSA